ncbi:T9SS type A sorting domain-containing protein [Spirosoma endophyticum]|uniref:Por secretion system C-terminal sorting domain-containing protein n=1 Tax=Spirosoma endophyticum TaxID=662367 RepID=A0A1I1X6A6_9BACT|nr:T9SS type A sorting domain-containing protein [Spirosoma endophyticum]SFE02934.1 Por secretion system C-terminal sorting domain-containing protein [Spirosoma endophyticum]
MNGRNLYSYLFIWLCISGLVTHSFAQTITTISPASVCAGGAVTISYTISGTFAAGNIFTAQLSDAAGSFASPAIIGSITSVSAGSVNATIPASTANGAGYHIRLVSSTPAATGTASSQALTVNKPASPDVTQPKAYCVGETAVPLIATGSSLKWYDAADNPLPGTPTPATTTAGIQIFKVSQTVGTCESSKATITVTVNAKPVPPSVGNVDLCLNGPSAPLTANGSNLKWFDAAGTLLGGAPTPSTSAVGPQVFKVSQTSAAGCESDQATINVTTKSLSAPPVGNPAAYCQGAGASPLSASGANLLWYGLNQTGGTGNSTATTPSTDAPGTLLYYVTQNVNGCESSRASIPVTVVAKASPPGTSPLSYCVGQSAAALTATGDNPRWYLTQTGGTPLAAAPIPATNAASSITYYVSQTKTNTCESDRTGLTVTVNPTPASPGVGPIGICLNGPSSQLSANGTNLKWYSATDNLLSGAPTPGTGTVGDQVFKVSQTSAAGCESPKATLTVTVKPLPNAPGVVNRAFCLQTQDQPAQNVEALNAFGENLKWYNPDGTFTTIAPVPPISQTGVQTYSVSQTYNGCESPNKSTLLVTVGTAALPVAVKSLVTYCINDKAVPLEATGETGGSLRWIDPYGNVSNVAPIPLTLNTSIQAGGDPFYVYQIGSNGCYSGRTTIKALVNALPTLSLVPSATSINIGQRVALQLKFTSAAPFSYTLTNGLSTSGLIGVVNKSDTTLSLLPTSTATYQIVSVRNSCGVGLPGNPATATIAVRVPTITTSTLTQLTACVGTSLSVPFTSTGDFNTGNLFRFELVSVADTSKKFSVQGTATASPVTAPLPLTLASGQYYVRVKADNPEIAIIGSNSPTPLTVRSLATATLAGTQKIYEGYPGSLTFTFGGDGPWTVTYADSVQSYSAVATASPYPAEVRPTRTTTYRLTSVANGCGTGTISGTAIITVLPLLGVDDNSLDPLVKTYPVPTTSILTVEVDLPLTRDPATLSLTTMSGRPVLQQTTRNKRHELDLTAQPSGLYLLHIQVGDRQTTRKVMKQ